MKWEFIDGTKLVVGHYKSSKLLFDQPIAGFDLDDTIIKTKSGKKFPVDNDDWVLLYPEVKSVLKQLIKDNYYIVIISNQKGLKTVEAIEEWKSKLDDICKLLSVPITIYGILGDNQYRKPLPTVWNLITQQSNQSNFYCGDAAGRDGDFSNTDITFALNVGIQFYTPEHKFLNLNNFGVVPDRMLTKHTKSFNPNETLPKSPSILMMVGYPGSGKTRLSQWIINNSSEWRWCNRDELSTDAKCLKIAKETLDNGQSIIIDNTNPTPANRKPYIDLAKKLNIPIHLWILDISLEVAWHQNWIRTFKTGLDPVPKVAYYTYRKRYIKPTLDEGFSSIRYINPGVSAEDFMIYNMYTPPIN